MLYLSAAWTSLFLLLFLFLFLFLKVFEFKHYRIRAIIVISNSIMPGEKSPSGMLAVFMQPDSSLDEDAYAQSLNVAEKRYLHYQVPRVV